MINLEREGEQKNSKETKRRVKSSWETHFLRSFKFFGPLILYLVDSSIYMIAFFLTVQIYLETNFKTSFVQIKRFL